MISARLAIRTFHLTHLRQSFSPRLIQTKQIHHSFSKVILLTFKHNWLNIKRTMSLQPEINSGEGLELKSAIVKESSSGNVDEQHNTVEKEQQAANMHVENLGEVPSGVKATEEPQVNSEVTECEHGVKRTCEADGNDNTEKKAKIEERKREHQKKKVAMLLVYSGKGYMGMQRNPTVRTIEGDLLDALLKAGVITKEHFEKPGTQMSFNRASRTDKGVSAAGQVCSLKMFVDILNPVDLINAHLPPQIRILGFKRTTKGFDAKYSATARTYIYVLPTFALTPVDQITAEDYRVSDDIIKQVNEVLLLFKGTHKFHNYTSSVKAEETRAKRFIMEIECGTPFVQDGLEFSIIRIKGQSFMLHQIRKMIGMTIAVIRGLVNIDFLHKAWEPEKADVPKAPGLGLVLDKLHFDQYNDRYGSDGIHVPLKWDEYSAEIEQFKRDYIFANIIEGEKKDKSMLNWLSTLSQHDFSEGEAVSGLACANRTLKAYRKQEIQHNNSENCIQEGKNLQPPLLVEETLLENSESVTKQIISL